jgi:hypothetical protein
MRTTWLGLLGLLVALALPLSAAAGPLPSGVDTDADTIDDNMDNCLGVANASQVDANYNGCGDACAPPGDTNGDDVVGVPDFIALGQQFGNTGCGTSNPPCSADVNGDTVVGVPDFNTIGGNFGGIAGASAIKTTQCNPASCTCTP